MALTVNSTFIPLAVGLSNDVAEKLVQPGKGVQTLQNCVFDKEGQVIKRYGTQALASVMEPGTVTLPCTWQLAEHKDALVSISVTGEDPISVRSPNTALWSNTGETNSALKSKRRTSSLGAMPFKLTAGGYQPEIAYGTPTGRSPVYAVTWRHGSTASELLEQAIFDANTLERIWFRTSTDAGVTASAAIRKVVITNNYAVFIYSSGGDFKIDKVNLTTL